MRFNMQLPVAWSFFFSSRRRHTRFDCDWSSDVCSSDLLSLPRLDLLAYRFVRLFGDGDALADQVDLMVVLHLADVGHDVLERDQLDGHFGFLDRKSVV